MTKMMTLAAVAGLLFSAKVDAKIWRVNSTPGFSADASDLVDLFDNVNVMPFDTIHLEGSTITYTPSQVTCDIPLVFIGPGFYLGLPNGNQGLQANETYATITKTLTLGPNAAGTRMYGIRFNVGSSTALNVQCSDVVISRNLFDGNTWAIVFVGSSTFQNIMISKNYFLSSSIGESPDAQTFPVVHISNNIFVDSFLEFTGANDSYAGVVIRSNVFSSWMNGDFCQINGAELHDNIFALTGATASISTQGNLIHYNLASGSSFLPNGGGNVNNVNGVDMTTVFEGAGSVDAMFALQPGVDVLYPASDGGERGIFGGSDPYVLSGIPPVPTIYHLLVPTNAQAGTPLLVEISTRSND
ncbi:MAG: hypothetical protein H6592_14580 [Flavobacteriales bacterium]|nr:hypothetical protein [Flavobacteriales bacterium]